MDNILQRRSQNSFKTNLTNMSTRRSKTVNVHNFTSSRSKCKIVHITLQKKVTMKHDQNRDKVDRVQSVTRNRGRSRVWFVNVIGGCNTSDDIKNHLAAIRWIYVTSVGRICRAANSRILRWRSRRYK